MRPKENYRPFVMTSLILTLTIMGVFQVYILREPARILAQEEEDYLLAVDDGQVLFAENCSSCHGESGEGDIAPPLNSKNLLELTPDEALFNLTKSGVPGTIMPAWGQSLGGPFTDEEINKIVTYIRAWEATAPEIVEAEIAPDPVRGAAIYDRTCFVCHGESGMGNGEAPPINDPERLSLFDDAWYRSTISYGRPAKGMPTWGTVLSPAQINDVVALIAAWREGQTVVSDTSLITYIGNTLFAIQQFDQVDAEFYLQAAIAQASDEEAEQLEHILKLVQENQLFLAKSEITAFLPPEEMGQALFVSNCAPCHGDGGTGGMGPNLHSNGFIQTQTEEDLLKFIQAGQPGTAMEGFEGVLSEEEILNIILVLSNWQE